MTDKEFKRLSRAQLIDIIYQLQLKEEELLAENQKLKDELADKRIRLSQAGNIAEAALAINDVMQAAQRAADQYLEEIRKMHAESKAGNQHTPANTNIDDSSYDDILREILEEHR